MQWLLLHLLTTRWKRTTKSTRLLPRAGPALTATELRLTERLTTLMLVLGNDDQGLAGATCWTRCEP